DLRAGRAVHHADDVPLDGRLAAGLDLARLADLPTDPGDALGNPTVDLAFQQLDDLWPPLVPPLFRGRDLLPVLRLEDLRQPRVGIGPRLVVIRRIRRVRIAAPAGTKL